MFSGSWQSGRDMDAATDKSVSATTSEGHLSQYTGETSTTFYPPVDMSFISIGLIVGALYLMRNR